MLKDIHLSSGMREAKSPNPRGQCGGRGAMECLVLVSLETGKCALSYLRLSLPPQTRRFQESQSGPERRLKPANTVEPSMPEISSYFHPISSFWKIRGGLPQNSQLTPHTRGPVNSFLCCSHHTLCYVKNEKIPPTSPLHSYHWSNNLNIIRKTNRKKLGVNTHTQGIRMSMKISKTVDKMSIYVILN